MPQAGITYPNCQVIDAHKHIRRVVVTQVEHTKDNSSTVFNGRCILPISDRDPTIFMSSTIWALHRFGHGQSTSLIKTVCFYCQSSSLPARLTCRNCVYTFSLRFLKSHPSMRSGNRKNTVRESCPSELPLLL